MIRCSPSIYSILCLLVIAIYPLPSVFSQSATATLSGTVEDPNGAVIPNASVTVENVATSLRRQTVTNGEGYFTVPLLPPSTYTVRVEGQGFSPAQINNVVLNVGDQKSLKIQLKTGNISEMVQISADAPLINESPAVATIVDRQFVANIPLNGRSFQSLISLSPGVVITPAGNTTNAQGQFSVNGQRPTANNFAVDGVSANFGTTTGTSGLPGSSGNLPGLTTFGSTQSLISLDALQEFKIQTSSYAAEYGRQPGGQISMVSRSGTNQFHGTLFDYVRNDILDANDWFASANRQPKAAERQNDFGGTFSGPVLLPRFGDGGRQPGYDGRNRTFFFFSYEGLRLRLPLFSLTNVPTLALRQQAPAGIQPILNAFPLPNGKNLGNGLAEYSAGYSNPSQLDSLGIRIDHALKPGFQLFARYNWAPSESVNRLAGQNLGFTRTGRLKNQTLTIAAINTFGSRANNELRVNFSDNQGIDIFKGDQFGGAQPFASTVLIPPQFDSPTAFGNIQLNFSGLTTPTGFIPMTPIARRRISSQRQFNIVDNFGYHDGRHELKFGVDYRRLMPTNDFNSYSLVAFYTSQAQIMANSAGTATLTANIREEPLVQNFSAYAQDTWKVSARLSLDLGVRWDVNPAPTERNSKTPAVVDQIDNLATMQLAPFGTRQWKTTWNNFAPRLGAAVHLSDRSGRELLLRGGFGVFYDSGNDLGTANFLQRFPYASSRTFGGLRFPLSLSQVTPSPLPIDAGLPTPYGTFVAYDPNLKLPYTLQWNFSMEQSLGRKQTLTASYVGAAGRRLLQQTFLTLTPINPKFTTVQLVRNTAESSYNGLQLEFQRRLSRGLQALVSYTWSHALDDDSSGLMLRNAQHGNADFDVRHVFAAAVTYNLPTPTQVRFIRALFGRWSLDTSIHAQSGLPVDLIARTQINPIDGSMVGIRPNVIASIPFYLEGSQYPGGRTLNNVIPTAAQIASAGCAPLSATFPAKGAFCTPPTGQSGTFGRNQVPGLPAWQVDVALRREFKLSEKVSLQFRGEGFNIFNHPNFGAIQTSLGAANFGQATNMLNRQLSGISTLYQIGGPRSFQFAMKLGF